MNVKTHWIAHKIYDFLQWQLMAIVSRVLSIFPAAVSHYFNKFHVRRYFGVKFDVIKNYMNGVICSILIEYIIYQIYISWNRRTAPVTILMYISKGCKK